MSNQSEAAFVLCKPIEAKLWPSTSSPWDSPFKKITWSIVHIVHCQLMQVVGSLQGFRPLASSREVELPHSAPIAVKLTGNILQVSISLIHSYRIGGRGGVLDEPYSAKPAQRSSHTGPQGYIGWTRLQSM